MIIAIISAATIEIHIPLILKKTGSISTAEIWNTSVRKNEISAEIRPLLSAVKKEEPKIDIPANRNEKEKMRNPLSVKFSSSAS